MGTLLIRIKKDAQHFTIKSLAVLYDGSNSGRIMEPKNLQCFTCGAEAHKVIWLSDGCAAIPSARGVFGICPQHEYSVNPIGEYEVLVDCKTIWNRKKEDSMEELITISREEYDELIADQNFLSALMTAGVDNWEGFEQAQDTLENEIILT